MTDEDYDEREDEEGIVHLTVNEITDIQWDQIRDLARGMIKSKMYGNDPFKCTVTAFLHWVSLQKQDLAVGVGMGTTHH